jgi:hypothetical protein
MSQTVLRILLWIEAAVCFGPLAFVVWLGALIFPVWVGMLAAMLFGVVPTVDPAGGSVWHVVAPMGFVLGGVTGLVGLVRVLLALSRREAPLQPSSATSVMLLVGLLTLVSFNLYSGGLPGNTSALMVYVVLPGIGSLHLLFLSRAIWLPSRDGRGSRSETPNC